jgi:hypothetical protein
VILQWLPGPYRNARWWCKLGTPWIIVQSFLNRKAFKECGRLLGTERGTLTYRIHAQNLVAT